LKDGAIVRTSHLDCARDDGGQGIVQVQIRRNCAADLADRLELFNTLVKL
jgi:hypothetical protein